MTLPAKSPAADRTTRRDASSQESSSGGAQRRLLTIVGVLVSTALIIAAIAGLRDDGHRGPANEEPSGALGHVHDVAIDDRGVIHVASHAGLFRIDGESAAVRVSPEGMSLLSIALAGPGHFVATVHPNENGDGSDNGLIESADGGVTWRPMPSSGIRPMQSLRVAHGQMYGYDGALVVSSDRRTWQTRSETAIGAFAIDPADPDGVLAMGIGGLQRSTDGGRTWRQVPGSPPVDLLAWDEGAQVWGVDPAGGIWRSPDRGTSWQRAGQAPGEPHAAAVHHKTLVVAVNGKAILSSADGGVTWTPRA